MTKNSILIVEDDPAYYVVIEGMLKRWGYKTIWAKSGKEALEILTDSDSPQLTILDWLVPEPNGVEICKILKERFNREIKKLFTFSFDDEESFNPPRYIYTIILTAKTEIEDLVYALEKGADDYIIKPFNASELQARIRVGFRIINLYNRFVQSQSKLKRLATCDYLTGILNRMSIIQRLKEEIYRCKREGGIFSIVMTDIDKFKSINDTYGHLTGDRVLIGFTKLVQSVLRKYDKLGRIGGEEFLIFLLNCGFEEAYKIAERIRYTVANTPISIGKGKVNITASFGVATWNPKKYNTVDDLLKVADHGVYAAKAKGGNMTVVMEDDI